MSNNIELLKSDKSFVVLLLLFHMYNNYKLECND